VFPWIELRDFGLRLYMHVLRGVALVSDSIAGVIAAEDESLPRQPKEPEIERASE